MLQVLQVTLDRQDLLVRLVLQETQDLLVLQVESHQSLQEPTSLLVLQAELVPLRSIQAVAVVGETTAIPTKLFFQFRYLVKEQQWQLSQR